MDAGQISSHFVSIINQEDIHHSKTEVYWLFLLYCIRVKEDILFVSDYMVLVDCCVRILNNEGSEFELAGVVRNVLQSITQMTMYAGKVGTMKEGKAW